MPARRARLAKIPAFITRPSLDVKNWADLSLGMRTILLTVSPRISRSKLKGEPKKPQVRQHAQDGQVAIYSTCQVFSSPQLARNVSPEALRGRFSLTFVCHCLVSLLTNAFGYSLESTLLSFFLKGGYSRPLLGFLVSMGVRLRARLR
jgi:hypothetical protein